MPGQWMTVREALELTHYDGDHLRAQIRRGKIKARKVATVWLVHRGSLLAYVRRAQTAGDKRYGARRGRHIDTSRER